MSAGKSSPIPAPGCGSACRQNWCRSNPATPTAPSGRPPTGTIQIQLARRKEANPTTAKLAEAEKKEPAGRTIDYTVVKPDFFVLSGLQGLKKFYVRGTFKGDEVRILTILYDQAIENTVEPVVIAMSSAFNPFPSGAQIAGPPPRKTVEYGTGVIVSEDGAIVTDRQVVDGCLAIAISGHGNADRVAEDKDHDLALLRIYGARGLKPLNLANGAAKPGVELTGIADPQNQGGGAAASSVKAMVAQVGGGSDRCWRRRRRSAFPVPRHSMATANSPGSRCSSRWWLQAPRPRPRRRWCRRMSCANFSKPTASMRRAARRMPRRRWCG